MSVAYLTADGPAEPYIRAVQAIEPEPVAVRISDIDLIEMHRDRRMYEWSVVARLPLHSDVPVAQEPWARLDCLKGAEHDPSKKASR